MLRSRDGYPSVEEIRPPLLVEGGCEPLELPPEQPQTDLAGEQGYNGRVAGLVKCDHKTGA